MLIYLVLCFFIVLIIHGLRKKLWGVSVYLIVVYTVSLVFSVLYTSQYNEFDRYKDAIIPSILYCVLLFICIKPFFRNKPDIIGFKDSHELKRFIGVGYFFGILLTVSIILVIPQIRFIFNYGVGNIRNDIQQGVVSIGVSGISSIGYRLLLYFGNMAYPLLLMFFYSLVFIEKRVLFKALLLIGSLSQVVMGLFVGGRTNIVYYALSFGFSLILFFKLIPRKRKIYILSISGGIFAAVIIYLSIVSAGRFQGAKEGVDFYNLRYAAIPYLNFCKFFEEMHWHPYSLRRIFPFSLDLFLGQFDLLKYRNTIFTNSGMNIGTFVTFLGDLFIDIGFIGLVIYVLLYYFITKKTVKGNSYNISNIMCLGIVYIIPLHGLFYYSAYQSQVTFCMMLTFILAKYINGNIVVGIKNR